MDGNTGAKTANAGKFRDPAVTADGAVRATVALTHPKTLWFNTGTLCNIACANCYIDSSPTNDQLEYISAKEVARYLDELG
ncbi:MAG TPA: radical SAM protein, partial [Rhodobacteraceae bacterium]|nr:radical SAM protein [Paracoccaceae bacterium]